MRRGHPDDVEVGYVEEREPVLVERAEMIEYAARNDPFRLHVDREAARRRHSGT